MKYKMVDLPKKTINIRNRISDPTYDTGDGCWICGKRLSKTNGYMFAQSCVGKVYDVNDPETNSIEGDGGESIGWFPIGSECRNKLPKTHTIKRKDWEKRK
tara:strand:+ start:79 stop:381 length:303 start_codon:yes stop_codon:yes gene_type:complete